MREIEYTLLLWRSLVLAAFVSKFLFFFLRIRLEFVREKGGERKLLWIDCLVLCGVVDRVSLSFAAYKVVVSINYSSHARPPCSHDLFLAKGRVHVIQK